ncbi:MAG: SWIM zinc finger family protein [SAR324 cluster bacterium]|nr:SWIM zinc finger family protein [SAR324 cluster bacterium]
MAKVSKSWWGKRFIKALEDLMEENHLKRGKSCLASNRIMSFNIERNMVTARIRGNTNPNYGIYREPQYSVSIQMGIIARRDWDDLIEQLGRNAAWITRLILGEVPDGIQEVFSRQGFPLLPESRDDFSTSCSCPDYMNPCKHVAGVYYKIAELLDHDPLLLFELRGLPRQELRDRLMKTPLGQALSARMDDDSNNLEIVPQLHRFTPVHAVELPPDLTLKTFWRSTEKFPQFEPSSPAQIVGGLIKKQGDYPAFWNRDNSFLEIMDIIYQQVRNKIMR